MNAILDIADRAELLFIAHGATVPHWAIVAALTRAQDLCPMDLDALARTDDDTLIQDVAGILEHLDLHTGVVCHGYLPRFARILRN